MDDNATGANNLLEMDAFLTWVVAGGASDNPEVAAFVNAHQSFPLSANNASKYPNLSGLKTAMRFAGPAVTMTQADAAISSFRAL